MMTSRAAAISVLLCALVAAGPVLAQSSPSGIPEHIAAAQLRAGVAAAAATPKVYNVFKDPKARTLAVRRDRSGELELHDRMNDIMLVQAGAADLLMGGRAEGARQVSPGEWRGGSIVGGQTYHVAAGDVIWIPAGVPHQMLLKPAATFDYLAIKTDKAP